MEENIRTKWVRNTLIVLLMTGFIAYAVYHCLQYFKNPVQTTVAVRQSEVRTQEMTAYLFRDEEVLTTAFDGARQPLVEDGTHVAVDSEVARVYANGEVSALYDQLSELDRQIAFYIRCLDGAKMSFSALNELNEQISLTYGDVMRAMTSGDGTQVEVLSEELLRLLNQKQILTGELTDMPAKLAALQEQRRALEATYAGTYESITAGRSGYYFRETDGYEGIFSSTALSAMTASRFYELMEQSPATTRGHAGKLVRDYVWYAAVPTTVAMCEEFQEGYQYTVTFADGASVEMVLDRILLDTGENSGRGVLIFETGQMPQGFAYTRIQTVIVEVGQTQGLRIPQTALVVGKDGEMGVYILDIAYVRYRTIDIIWRGDGYVLVRETDHTQEGHENDLRHQEILITQSDEALYDGKLLY